MLLIGARWSESKLVKEETDVQLQTRDHLQAHFSRFATAATVDGGTLNLLKIEFMTKIMITKNTLFTDHRLGN